MPIVGNAVLIYFSVAAMGNASFVILEYEKATSDVLSPIFVRPIDNLIMTFTAAVVAMHTWETVPWA